MNRLKGIFNKSSKSGKKLPNCSVAEYCRTLKENETDEERQRHGTYFRTKKNLI